MSDFPDLYVDFKHQDKACITVCARLLIMITYHIVNKFQG